MKQLLFVTDSLGDANQSCRVNLEDTYAYRLEMLLRPDVYSKTFIVEGNTMRLAGDMVRTWYDAIGDRKVDVAVVQVGINDSAIRAVPTLIYHALPYLPRPLRERVFKFIHQNRAGLQRMGLKFHFTSVKAYRQLLTQMIDRLTTKCEMVFILNIAPGDKEVYEHSPGLEQSIQVYNKCIQEVTSSRPVHLIDLSFMKDDPEKYLGPKLHILKAGHDYILNEIVAALKKDGKLS